eukprot:348933-Amphidinium_carterae.1
MPNALATATLYKQSLHTMMSQFSCTSVCTSDLSLARGSDVAAGANPSAKRSSVRVDSTPGSSCASAAASNNWSGKDSKSVASTWVPMDSAQREGSPLPHAISSIRA